MKFLLSKPSLSLLLMVKKKREVGLSTYNPNLKKTKVYKPFIFRLISFQWFLSWEELNHIKRNPVKPLRMVFTLKENTA